MALARTILHLIETGGPGGAERMMVHLAGGLGREYRSEAALIRDSWLGMALQRRGIPVTMLRRSSESSFAILRNLLMLIRKRQVEILHTHEFFMNALGLVASRVTGVPVVATVHGKNYYTDRFRRRIVYQLVGRYASQLIAVSEDVRQFLGQRVGISSDRIRVVPNGVPVDDTPSQEKVLALRKDLDLNQNTRVIGTVGSLYPVKGHTYLIDAAVPVVSRFPGAVFLVVGRGGLRDELEAQAQRLGVARYFRFLGHRDDVSDLLGVCNVFALPSLSEGMPLALLEAMAAGVPPVATRVGGIAEVIEHGSTGLLVPAADSHAMAENIITLLEDRDLARDIGESARKVVARRFSLTGMVQTYQEIYADLLQKSKNQQMQE